MSENKDIIKLSPLSEEQITEMQIANEDLWMVKAVDGKIYGPYDTESLRTFSDDNQEVLEESMAYNLETESWKYFYKIPKFQRRKPKLVPIQSLIINDNFLILINGEKKGPYSFEEICTMVDEKKIALNVQASLDEGESWIKLYEHHAFDRRLKKTADDLPFVPEKSILDGSNDLVQKNLLQHNKEIDEEDALIGLAFIGHGNDKGQIIHSFEDYSTHKKTGPKALRQLNHGPSFEWFDKVKEKINFKYTSGAFFALLIVFSAFNSFHSRFSADNSNITQTAKENIDQKSIDNSNRTPTKKMAINNQVKPAENKIVRAKKYEPTPRKNYQRPVDRQPASSKRNNRRKQIHTDERYEAMDIDDPQVKEDLTRELASDPYGNDQVEELSQEQRDFIEQANEEGFSDGDQERMENQDAQYDVIQDFE